MHFMGGKHSFPHGLYSHLSKKIFLHYLANKNRSGYHLPKIYSLLISSDYHPLFVVGLYRILVSGPKILFAFI